MNVGICDRIVMGQTNGDAYPAQAVALPLFTTLNQETGVKRWIETI